LEGLVRFGALLIAGLLFIYYVFLGLFLQCFLPVVLFFAPASQLVLLVLGHGALPVN
jgi:hypothetical protein